MIKYNLKCKNCSNNFDSWFSSSKEFEKLKKNKYLNCPNCNSIKIEKSLMAPSIINKNQNDNFKSKKNSGPRINERIASPEVRVIGADGKQLGVLSIRQALNEAEQAGFDLVEISPEAKPPVCKIIDYGKLKYKEQKKKNQAKKKQKTIEVKEIKIRPGIEKHDYDVKMRALSKFIDGGNKVKVTMRFRGREMEHQHLGFELLKKLEDDVVDIAKIEVPPKRTASKL